LIIVILSEIVILKVLLVSKLVIVNLDLEIIVDVNGKVLLRTFVNVFNNCFEVWKLVDIVVTFISV
jgi:hypothetical protein